jgi:hypothetical protein
MPVTHFPETMNSFILFVPFGALPAKNFFDLRPATPIVSPQDLEYMTFLPGDKYPHARHAHVTNLRHAVLIR